MSDSTEISKQFGSLPMSTLLGGPLQAACNAQMQLANATANFIKTVGLTPKDPSDPNSELVARTVEFKYKQAREDGGGFNDMVIETPLISIVRVPNLSINSMDITFDMEVKTTDEHKDSTDTSAELNASAKYGGLFFKTNVNIKGSVSSHRENTRKTDTTAKYHVELHASDAGQSEGLSRILDIMYAAIQPKSENDDSKESIENKENKDNNKDNKDNKDASAVKRP